MELIRNKERLQFFKVQQVANLFLLYHIREREMYLDCNTKLNVFFLIIALFLSVKSNSGVQKHLRM